MKPCDRENSILLTNVKYMMKCLSVKENEDF